MALSLKPDQDERLNPSESDYRSKFDGKGSNYVNAGLDQAESYANDPYNSSEKSLQDQERDGGFYKPNLDGGKKNSKAKSKLNLKNLKKGGPLAAIITSILGVLGIGSVLLTPGLSLVHLKETLTNDLNDQLAALDIGGTHVFKQRLKGLSSGVCTGINIKCKFSSMSKSQMEKFKKAGFTFEGAETNKLGRYNFTSMTSPEGLKLSNPSDLNAARSNHEFRRSFNRAYNPIYAGFSDKTFNKVMSKLGTHKGSKLKSSNTEGLSEDMKNATRGLNIEMDESRFRKNSAGEDIYVDDDGNTHTKGSATYEEASKRLESNKAKLPTGQSGSAGKAFSKIGGSVAKGVMVTGAADTACTVYNSAIAISATAKIIRSMQLAQYAMVYLTTADKIMAGTATPEEVEYLGNLLTTTDSQEEIYDESYENNMQAGISAPKTTSNPFYGKNAFDSPGFKVAAFNDTPTLTARSQQYMVGGGFSGEIGKYVDDASSIVGGRSNAKSTCGIIQNPITRVLSGAAGIVIGISTLGIGTAISATASVGIAFAIPFLEAYLSDIVAGTVVDETTYGVDAGDAIFAGTASLMGESAKARGLQPLSVEGIEEYAAVTNSINNENIAQAKFEAQDTPFDIMNQYSFLGSFARTLIPASSSINGTVVGFIGSIPKLLSTPLSSLSSTAKAASVNPDRFKKCDDPTYADLGIDADIFCNVRYGLSNYELSLETDTVVDYMFSNDYIDEDGVSISGSDYDKFIDNCVDRVSGWGESTEENGSTGSECIGDDQKLSMFRVFTLHNSINEAMDDEGIATANTSETAPTDTTEGSTAEGLSEDQANKLVNLHKEQVRLGRSSPYIPNSAASYPRECVTFTKFFMAKYMGRTDSPMGNGNRVVANLGNAGYKTGTKPELFAVASFQAGSGSITSNAKYGHTGVVVAVYDDGSILLAEAGAGFVRNGYVNVQKVSASRLAASKTTYAYVGDKMSDSKKQELLNL